MKTKLFVITSAAAVLIAHATFSQDTQFALEPIREPTLTLSLGISSLSFGRDDYGAQFAKDSTAFLPKLQLRLPDTPVSFILKCTFASWDYEDYFAYDGSGFAAGFGEEKHTSVSLDAELRFDIYKSDLMNLYASAGVYYEKVNMEADLYAGTYSPARGFEILEYAGVYEDDIDGTTGIAHVGIELFPGDWYINAEVGYLGKVYSDEDDEINKAQAELAGTVGYFFHDNWRIDANAQYFTHSKTLFAGGALTFLY